MSEDDYEKRLRLQSEQMLVLLRQLVRWQESGQMDRDFQRGWKGQPEELVVIAKSLIAKVEGEPADGNG